MSAYLNTLQFTDNPSVLDLDRKEVRDYSSIFEVNEVFHDFGIVQLSRVTLTPTYAHAWNENERSGFLAFTISRIPIYSALYKIPTGKSIDSTQRYFVIDRYDEGVQTLLEIPLRKYGNNESKLVHKKCLIPKSCIFDSCGNEKIVFEKLKFGVPHIISGSCIFKVNEWHFNIETRECYGFAHGEVNSKDSIFLQLEDRAVIKIDKFTGESQVFE